jgi:aldehyde:ferredoxin oxidoreductase
MIDSGYGYSGTMLRVDLSSGKIAVVPTRDYADFIGGRGIAAGIHWAEVPSRVRAFDPENILTFITGPLTGFPGFGSSRLQVCGKSADTEPQQFCYSNLGGSWGVNLKFAGYDGLVVRGKADRPVYLVVDETSSRLRPGKHIWGKGAIETRTILKGELGNQANVITYGQAGENRVAGATLLADRDASGAGGLASVMGSKNLKAVVLIPGHKRPQAAHPERLRELILHLRRLVESKSVFYDYFLKEYHPVDPKKMKKDYCWGCPGPCLRESWKAGDGTEGKFFCQASSFYRNAARKYYGQEGDVPFQVNKLCDNYGIDTRAFRVIVNWLPRCYQAGILTEEETGVPLSREGSFEYAASLLRKMALREGFGDLLAQGVLKAARAIGKGAEELIGDLLHKAHQDDTYGPRMYLVNGLLWAMEPRQPIQQLHEVSMLVEQWLGWVRGLEGFYVSGQVLGNVAERFFGSKDAADCSSYEGKALAAKRIQDREYAIESLILCNMMWPVMTSLHTEDHVGDSSLESKFYSAVTGIEADESALNRMGERIFNLQRAIWVREGHRDELPDFMFNLPLRFQPINPEMLAPGPDGKPISRKGAVVDRERFERMKREYYALRGWDPLTGKQTRSKLAELELSRIADELERGGLVASV